MNEFLPDALTLRFDVSIILICWNSLELTTCAIRSLQLHTTRVSYQLIIVDNGSTLDGGAAELARRFPAATIIANPDNRGFAAANNQGLAIARGRYVLLLNSDTLQIENAVGRAVEYMDAHADVGVLGVMHRNADAEGTYQPSAASFPTPLKAIAALFSPKRPCHSASNVPPEGDVDWVTGSFFLIRSQCLERVGPLDERFFVYSEDIDWCYQVWKTGWKVRYWPGVSLIHLGSSSASQLADKTFMIHRNQMEFFRKNFSAPLVFAYYVAMGVRLALSTAYQTAKWTLGKAGWVDVQARWNRQVNFMMLRSDRRGLASP